MAPRLWYRSGMPILSGLRGRFRRFLGSGGSPPFRFVDIHAHVIPDVDDGPSCFEESVAMLRVAYERGTRRIVATPHMFLDPYDLTDPAVVLRRFGELASRLAVEGENGGENAFLRELRVYPGAENYLSPGFLDAVSAGSVLTLNRSRYLLVEFPPGFPMSSIRAAIGRIRSAFLVPVIAHVERLVEIQSRPGLAEELLAAGCVLQVNASSLGRGRSGRTSRFLLRRHLAHVVASDGHGAVRRPPGLDEVWAYLERSALVDEARRMELLGENPRRLIEDREPASLVL